MKNIIIKPEYGCFPLWISDENCIQRNINHFELEISDELKKKIEDWDLTFQSTFNKEYPPNSGFISNEELQYYENTGKIILDELIKQLPNNYIISNNY